MAKKEANFLDYIPRRNKNFPWEEKEGLVVIQQENIGLMKRLTQWLLHKPRYSFIELDSFGSFVWMQIDGHRSVYEIGQLVEQEFGDKAAPLYERLSTFIKMLHKERFVVYENKIS